MITPTLYIAGPMTGLPDDNRPAFISAAAMLREAGYTVINPAETTLPNGTEWGTYMRAGITAMMDHCSAVAHLTGVESSRGARAEIAMATHLGWRVMPVAAWLKEAELTTEESIRAELLSYLQRDLLTILKQPRALGAWKAQDEHAVLDLRDRIHRLSPTAALYTNLGGPMPAHLEHLRMECMFPKGVPAP